MISYVWKKNHKLNLTTIFHNYDLNTNYYDADPMNKANASIYPLELE